MSERRSPGTPRESRDPLGIEKPRQQPPSASAASAGYATYAWLGQLDAALGEALGDQDPDAFRDDVVRALQALAERESPSRQLYVQARQLAQELTSLHDLGALRPVLVTFVAGLGEAEQAHVRELLPW